MQDNPGFKLFLANLFIFGGLRDDEAKKANFPDIAIPEYETENVYCCWCRKQIGTATTDCMLVPFHCWTCAKAGLNYYKVDKAFSQMKFALVMNHPIREYNALLELTKEKQE